MLIIGNHENRHGSFLKEKYPNIVIRLYGSEFDKNLLDKLRYFANLNFHGHLAGATNPSLLEAMAASAKVCAHNNAFNRSVTDENAIYFDNSDQISLSLKNITNLINWQTFIENNLIKIRTIYKWELVIKGYYHLYMGLLQNKI